MRLSVIIPSRNSENLVPCVRAIRNAGETCRIVVIDDGLTEKPKGCTYIQGTQPFIFSRAINQGIAATGTDDVCLLNDDALLRTPEGFSALQRQWQKHPEYGIISAVTNFVGNPNQQPKRAGLRRELTRLCFVCVFIPRSTIQTVGLMDERFGGVTEDGKVIYGHCDDDMSRRVRNAGLQLGIYDFCYVCHTSLRSSFRDVPNPPDESASRKIYMDKWGSET